MVGLNSNDIGVIYSLSVTLLLSSESSLLASLNSLMPLPRPLINSGIFFPPNKSKTITTINTICHGPIAKGIILDIIILKFGGTKLIIKL